MTADLVSGSVDIVDNGPSEAQMTKTVEGRLGETLYKLAVTEGNLHLLFTLKKLGLSTNDVTSFVEKQAIHKRILRQTDNKVRKTAMQSKITDALAYAKRLRQEKNKLRQRIFKKYQDNRSKGKRIVNGQLRLYRQVKNKEYLEADRKIRFFKEKHEKDKSLKEIPEETSEFLRGVNLFSEGQNLKPQDPVGPFICHKSI